MGTVFQKSFFKDNSCFLMLRVAAAGLLLRSQRGPLDPPLTFCWRKVTTRPHAETTDVNIALENISVIIHQIFMGFFGYNSIHKYLHKIRPKTPLACCPGCSRGQQATLRRDLDLKVTYSFLLLVLLGSRSPLSAASQVAKTFEAFRNPTSSSLKEELTSAYTEKAWIVFYSRDYF